MPYIVTTYYREECYGVPNAVKPHGSHAVATLEEARTAVWRQLGRMDVDGYAIVARQDDAMTLPDTGGTIGPLPDGTVIEVRPTDWLELAGLAGWTLDWATRDRLTGRTRAADRDALLAAHNAR